MKPGDQQEPNQSSSLLRAIRLAILLAIVCAVLSSSLPLSFAQGDLQVTFIDVGQGDAAWLRTPDGLDILVDGGEESQGPGLVSYLQSQGVTDIEVMVLTHPHADHVGGLVTVLQSMDVDAAVTNCQDHTSDVYQTFKDLLATKAIPTVCARDGDSLAWSSYISVTVVNPPEPLMSGTGSDLNNNSIVLRISLGTVDFLFTGDIEEEAETAILTRAPNLEAELLKVPHHGSDTSSTPGFLSQVDPEFAIISVGPNAWGHPSPDVIQRLQDAGATVCRTDEDGTIVATTDGTMYSVDCVPFHIYLPLVLKAWPPTPTPTPTPTSTPSPTPTFTPTPTPTATPMPSIQVSAWVSDPTPPQYTTVTVYGRFLVNGVGVAGVPMHTTWHYKTTTSYCDGVTDATGLAYCSRYISGATMGYTVVIDVEFTYGGQVYHTSTSFTPW